MPERMRTIRMAANCHKVMPDLFGRQELVVAVLIKVVKVSIE